MPYSVQEPYHLICPQAIEGLKRGRRESIVSIPQLPPATVLDGPTAGPHGDVDGSFTMISRAFQRLRITKETTVADVHKHLHEDVQLAQDKELDNVDKRGIDSDSFIHYLLKAPAQFETRLPLLKWVMERFPYLYREGVSEGKSILHILTMSKVIGCSKHLGTIVELYPAQVADILKGTPKEDRLQGRLLSDIIPTVQTSAPLEFLEFFGKYPEDMKPKQCICRECAFKNDTRQAANGSDGNQSKQPAPALDSNITSEEIGDGIILRWPKDLPDQSTAHARKSPTKEAEHPGIFRNREGQTPLHLAAGFRQCKSDQRMSQFLLVKHLFFWCPQALDSGSTKEHHHEKEDDISFFLRDQIMHLPDRDKVLELLYGRSKGLRSLALPGAAESKREIYLDLREVQMSASSSAKKDELLTFIRSLEFENILQYVQIPQYPFRKPGASIRPPATDVVEAKTNTTGIGRRDFEGIFDVLKEKGVRKILRLIVDDDDACLHQDDMIQEKLKDFEIEELQWRKMDLSSSVLRHAVPHARTLRLFSSGNHSVLRDWSSADGLNELGMLQSVYLKIYWKTESRATTLQYAQDFITRMITHCHQLRTVEIRLEPFTVKNHEEWPNRNLLVTTNKWLQTMQRFAGFVNNIQKLPISGEDRNQPPETPSEVRVAVLDDGIDWSFANANKCYGMSFYPDKRSDFEGHNVWYSSSTDHGTLMAALIQKICPDVTLYIARLDQTESEQGEFQPTPESAAKARIYLLAILTTLPIHPAIDWAVQEGVHIISMSWTIPSDHKCLDQAVEEARDRGILMFGSASDQGAKNSIKPYMAKLAEDGKGPVICIGGARDFGLADDRARSEGEFFFPGQTNGIPAPLPPLKSNFGTKTGSSVATALAAGLTALVMLLVDMSSRYGPNTSTKSGPAPNYRKELQDPMNIRDIFKSMLEQSGINKSSNETQKDIIIPVDMYFSYDRLNYKLHKAPTEKRREKGKELLDNDVLKRILRVLINKYEDKRATAESDGEENTEEE
ncbi:hypothetical protein F4802DRAFT_619718 [Xylaria palmicola]|nr:hypothetical protein F4802DRAFT_619718 [Xylaria palmicola]